MKTRFSLMVLAAVVLAIVLGGCSAGLSTTQRVSAFLSSINTDPQDIAEIKAHFSPDSDTYQTIDAASWSATLFDAPSRPPAGFSFGEFTENLADDGGYSGGVTITTTFTSLDVSAAPTTIVLVPDSDPLALNNWLIREIDVNGNVIMNLN